jgi:uroporphyrin-3 C-methyltransferase
MTRMDESAATDHPEPVKPRRMHVLLRLAVLFLVGAGGLGLWWTTRDDSTAVEAQTLRTQFEALRHEIAALRSTTDALRSRLDDGEKVDKSMREQLLGLDQRAKLVEDSIASLADKRLSGRDALALDEAELLLTLGGERFTLFHDATSASMAYRQADLALSEVEDPAFSTVRQSVAAELAALNGGSADAGTLALRLARVRAQAAQWPAAAAGLAAVPAENSSQFGRVLGAFVQIRHDDAAQTRAALHAPGMARELFQMDLHEAEAAALARDDLRYQAALGAARSDLGAAFDAQNAEVAAAVAELDNLSHAALAPPAPALLGTALRDLRNLRATHALREVKPVATRSAGETR